jgi:D-glycero-alpha-D-manno-heptose-7-phosphate kinase
VNPLRIRDKYLDELAHNLVLYHTETSRLSGTIIEEQQKNVVEGNEQSLEAMHRLREQAVMMKEAMLKGDLDRIGEILDFGWKFKKKMARGITNPRLDEIYDTAIRNGSLGGKVSGAGGGGFMFFYCPGNTRSDVIAALRQFGGQTKRYEFTNKGLTTWAI